MKKIAVFIVVLFLFSIISVSALTAEDAKQDWLDAKEQRLELDLIHKQAKLDYATDQSEENEQNVVDTAKDLLNALLDEARAWLEWKKIESEENDVSEELRDKIKDDVESNIDKIRELREDVENIENRAGVGVVSLRMIIKYLELLTDVARDSGYAWVEIAHKRADKIQEYEEKLRTAAEKLDDNDDLLDKLDIAKDELETARDKIDMAESAYDDVEVGGTPLVKFSEGNRYLRQARTNLINAHAQLEHVYLEMVKE